MAGRKRLADLTIKNNIEGYTIAIFALLEDKDEIPDDLRDRIMNEKDLDVLRNWMNLAAKTESIEKFRVLM